ncbi:hypothetical protein [Pelagibacterium lentulum]|uniref:Uncharacterized protein n=1 Tax=Pelagibacterium lentulum TaxID=2029865 RepID=A0A916RNK6_9HYPH|nr:hypothetical protein [Pelagibacterium lentulum]GGA63919.1 hypothetical protein GCM10011499_37900 [Pelagibacterium lentulum]
MGDAIALIGLLFVLGPVLTIINPKLFGIVGVLVLSAAGIFYSVMGQSAFTEITAAIFVVGAFLQAGLVVIIRQNQDE